MIKKTDRRSEIVKALGGISEDVKAVISPLIEEVVFIEDNLEELKKLPFIAVNPSNPAQQKYTAAYKQYKELFQQYTVSVKILLSVVDDKTTGGESPLQHYFNNRNRELEGRI